MDKVTAVVQNQIRKLEEKLQPYLHGCCDSHWSLLEQKTKGKVRREQIALGLLGVLALYLIFGSRSDFLCNLIGFLYPAYASILAIGAKPTPDDTEWLVYWVVYVSLGFMEYIGDAFFQTLPFYWLGKCLYLIWLMKSGPNSGSKMVYHRVLHPLALKFHPNIEKSSRDGSDYGNQFNTPGRKLE